MSFAVKEASTPHRLAVSAGIRSEVISALINIFEREHVEEADLQSGLGEIPTAEVLTRSAGPFPQSHLVGKTSALCVFTVRQSGIHDVIHVHNAGIENVTLVDRDDKWMDKMKKICPAALVVYGSI